jgi:hypothetical protein
MLNLSFGHSPSGDGFSKVLSLFTTIGARVEFQFDAHDFPPPSPQPPPSPVASDMLSAAKIVGVVNHVDAHVMM